MTGPSAVEELRAGLAAGRSAVEDGLRAVAAAREACAAASRVLAETVPEHELDGIDDGFRVARARLDRVEELLRGTDAAAEAFAARL